MNFEILERLPLEVLIHLFTALAAFFLGAWQIWGSKKGSKWHKQLGWLWFALMTTVATSAIFIQGLAEAGVWNLWGFSLIHLFVLLTFWSVPRAILAVRRGDIETHKKEVKGLYLGGMLIAGGFTFLPGRTMWHIFFGG
jgi:uncharacterized membrane protein